MLDSARTSRKKWAGFALIALALIALPFTVGQAGGPAWVAILDLALLYVMLALGLNIVVGYAGLLDLGYIAFYAAGAYVYALLASPHFGIHWPLWVLLPVGAAVAGVFGILLGAPTLKLRGDYLAIVTLGFGEIIRIFLNNLNAPINITNGPQGINRIDALNVAGVVLSKDVNIGGLRIPAEHLHYYLFLVVALLIIFVCMRLEDSRIGRAWVAIREDEVAAKAMGINTRNIKLLAFAMGASFGGVAGCLFAGFQNFVSPQSFVLDESVMVLCMVVLGGMGNIRGVILGAVILTFLPQFFRYTIVPAQEYLFGAQVLDPDVLRIMLFGVALVSMMLFRPSGIWPSQVRKRELAQ